MKIKVLIFLSLFFAYSNMQGQTLFLSDCFRGGVVGDGIIPWYYGDPGIIQLPVPSGSTIRKAYLFANISMPKDSNFVINNHTIEINNQPIVLSINQSLNFSHTIIGVNFHLRNIPIVIDVTNFINPTISNYLINPNSSYIPIHLAPIYNDFYILVLYENNIMPTTCIEAYINNQDVKPIQDFVLNLQNLFYSTKDIGLSINGSQFCDQTGDWSTIIINSDTIGKIGGTESNTNITCAGPIGSFYYDNETLYGIGNDTADSLMHGTDVIANIKSYVQPNGLVHLKSINPLPPTPNSPAPYSNQFNYFFLAYTSPCDTFSVTHTPDTTICYGVPLQLQVQGGQAWEWTPQVGLNCYDCPNPVFTADSTMHYSIRIWNNDSCSKVLPLHIVVEEALPHFHFDISPSECGDSTGSITITPVLNGFSYINQTTQDANTTGIFSGLESGFYPISIVNNSACSFDTVVFIPETLSVHAGFIANPNAGISALPVAFTNTSSHANSYQWIYENQSSTQENISHIFQQDGIYPVMLIAYGNSILCADTAYDTIYVYLPIEVEIPNIFTPNSDQNNDQWGIKINVPAEVDLQIFNRWGEVVLHKKEDITAPGFVPLWDGAKHSGGVYYYVIRVQTDFEKKEFKGNLTLVR